LNGNELKLGDGDALPDLASTAAPPGDHAFAPTTITFLALPDAENNACR
jgi:heparanase 1